MNRENILAVADAIEKHSIPDLGFNMGWLISASDGRSYKADRSGKGCGTVACIAGHAYALQHGVMRLPAEQHHFDQQADWLGLSKSEARELFFAGSVCEIQRAADGGWVDAKAELTTITPSQAVSVLRHLAETGEVDWDRALAEPSK